MRLGRLTALVGRNGAGKSNFLDALRFVTDGLQTSLDHAIKSRGGIKAVRRHSTGHPRNFAIQLQFNVGSWDVAHYGFEIAARSEGGFQVKQENLSIIRGPREIAHYMVADGNVSSKTHPTMPLAVSDRLYLVNVSGIPDFREAYDALVAMGFYNLNPEAMKELQSPDAGELLHRDGANLASVVARLEKEAPEVKRRTEQYLAKIVPGVVGADSVAVGRMETISFRQEVTGASHPWPFLAAYMSDGTLRALGMLIAVQQLAQPRHRIRLVGIEEPESALHPAAARSMMDALVEATSHTQVIVTTHSADLLEGLPADGDNILAVHARQGETFIAPIDAASRSAIHDHLYSAGELLRMDQLGPDKSDLLRQA